MSRSGFFLIIVSLLVLGGSAWFVRSGMFHQDSVEQIGTVESAISSDITFALSGNGQIVCRTELDESNDIFTFIKEGNVRVYASTSADVPDDYNNMVIIDDDSYWWNLETQTGEQRDLESNRRSTSSLSISEEGMIEISSLSRGSISEFVKKENTECYKEDVDDELFVRPVTIEFIEENDTEIETPISTNTPNTL